MHKRNKLGQEQKSKILAAMRRNAQEEMVGFALIIIIVAIIVLVFLGFSLRKPPAENVESYEVESFLQSVLQYTTDCESNVERRSMQQLISSCYVKEDCLDGRKSCDVLNLEISKMLDESWKIGEERPVKGYELNIITDSNEIILSLSQGEITANSKGAPQNFPRGERIIEVTFKAYY